MMNFDGIALKSAADMNNTLRDEAVAILCWSLSELDGCVTNLEGHDDRAAAAIKAARPHVIALRDKYADGSPAALPGLAAQELRVLADLLETMAADSGNPVKVGGRFNTSPPTLTSSRCLLSWCCHCCSPWLRKFCRSCTAV